jgi:hypothetical protein
MILATAWMSYPRARALFCDPGISVITGGQIRVERGQQFAQFPERGILVLQPRSTIHMLRRISVDRNEATQLSNHAHVDDPIAAAEIANSLTYAKVIDTFADSRHALFYTIVPVCLLLVLRLLRLCDCVECRCGSVNGLGDCYGRRRLRLYLSDSSFPLVLRCSYSRLPFCRLRSLPGGSVCRHDRSSGIAVARQDACPFPQREVSLFVVARFTNYSLVLLSQ